MKIAYAFRRRVFYPSRTENVFPVFLPPDEVRDGYLRKVRSLGFEGLELGFQEFNGLDEQAVRELAKEITDAGLPCVAIRGGGGMHHPRVAAENRKTLERTIKVANWMGAPVVNTTVITPPPSPDLPGSFVGEPVSQGGSRHASEADFQVTAKGLAEVADKAADLGVTIAIEVHQHSIVDNSWSALHMLEIIDKPNVGVNPDLGNIYWCYDVPEEPCEEAIVALAPHARYWHCKNLIRVHIPENEHSIFIRRPLPDGDIDYRFAISAMLDAGYDGYLAVEGMALGDQLSGDGRSAEYVRGLLKELKVGS